MSSPPTASTSVPPPTRASGYNDADMEKIRGFTRDVIGTIAPFVSAFASRDTGINADKCNDTVKFLGSLAVEGFLAFSNANNSVVPPYVPTSTNTPPAPVISPVVNNIVGAVKDILSSTENSSKSADQSRGIIHCACGADNCAAEHALEKNLRDHVTEFVESIGINSSPGSISVTDAKTTTPSSAEPSSTEDNAFPSASTAVFPGIYRTRLIGGKMVITYTEPTAISKLNKAPPINSIPCNLADLSNLSVPMSVEVINDGKGSISRFFIERDEEETVAFGVLNNISIEIHQMIKSSRDYLVNSVISIEKEKSRISGEARDFVLLSQMLDRMIDSMPSFYSDHPDARVKYSYQCYLNRKVLYDQILKLIAYNAEM